jgi:hypothetical protein
MRILLVLGAFALAALAPLAASRGAAAPAQPAILASDEELDAITAAAMDYAMSYFEGDGERMEKALHPHLAKRTIGEQNGRQSLSQMSALELVQIIRGGSGKKVPAAERRHDVQILDVQGDVATLKLTMNGWIDYMHLAKLNGRWQIVNVLWRVSQ